MRRIRLISGLALFVYVAAHLANHALGNVSVEAMEAGLVGMKIVWQSIPGTIVLYAAFLVHGALGFRALYERRVFRFGAIEVTQLVLGLLIPLILLIHITNTRIAVATTGFSKNYAQELYSFWIGNRTLGAAQVAMLIVAWIHGCIGVYFWLRLKPFFSRISSILLGLAVLWPALALLGFYQGGRTVLTLATQESWHSANLTAIEVGTLAEQAQLELIRNSLVIAYVAITLLVLAARGVRAMRERGGGLISLSYPERKTIKVPVGLSLLEASTRYEMPHAGVCGGRGRCGTCLVTVLTGLEHCPSPHAAESEMLANLRANDRPSLRLGCQLRPTGDLTFVPMLPPRAGTTFAYGGSKKVRTGRKRYVACLLVEMRDIATAEEDASSRELLFLINRFLSTVAQSVTDAGGQPNRIYGNGMLALFGLKSDPANACRQAIEATALLSANLDHLNGLLARENPIRFVVGLHAGEVTLGEIGLRDDLAFTAVGGAVRDATALLDLARLMTCEVLVSEHVCAQAGVRRGVLAESLVTLPGGARTMEVRTAERAAMVFGALDAIVDDETRQAEPPGNAQLAPA
jgi:adenylate cyclase